MNEEANGAANQGGELTTLRDVKRGGGWLVAFTMAI
jgi:hypothetical protein